MDKKISSYVFRNTIIRFLITLAIFACVMLLLIGIAYILLRQKAWHWDDPMYPTLHWINYNFGFLAIIFVLSGAMLISFIFFYRIARRMEVLMKQEQRQKEDMIMYMAHDLKTPLTSVLGYLKLLNDEKEISDEVRDHYMEIVLKKATRLDDLVNEFFEVTRMGSTQAVLTAEPVNFYRMIEQLVYEFHPIFATKKLQYKLSGDKDIFVRIDTDKIVRVIDNLLKNAVNYSYPSTTIYIDLKRKDKKCICTILNHGKTIPKEKLDHIFERFYRVDDDDLGTGLGLVIVKQMIEMHGGTITCESRSEKVQFTFTLPIVRTPNS